MYVENVYRVYIYIFLSLITYIYIYIIYLSLSVSLCVRTYIINIIIYYVYQGPFKASPETHTKFGQTAAKGAPWLMRVAMTTRYSKGQLHPMMKIDANCGSVK